MAIKSKLHAPATLLVSLCMTLLFACQREVAISLPTSAISTTMSTRPIENQDTATGVAVEATLAAVPSTPNPSGASTISPAGTTTPTPPNTSTATPTARPSPTPTPVPLFDVEDVFPMVWPVEPFSDAQIEEARACPASDRARERYSPATALSTGEPSTKTGCDWAALAMAYVLRAEYLELTATPSSDSFKTTLDLPKHPAAEGVHAFAQAVAANPAFAFTSSYNSPPLYAYYLNALPLVEPPPVAERPIVAVDVEFEQIGHVPVAQYDLHVENANTAPVVTGQITRWDYLENQAVETTENIAGNLRTGQVQSLGGEALSDLLPVDKKFRMGPGIGYAVNWQVALTFSDNSMLLLQNNGTLLFAGAPWFVEVEGQTYMQYSTDFLDALLSVTGALELPPGDDPALTRQVHWFDSALPSEAAFDRRQ